MLIQALLTRQRHAEAARAAAITSAHDVRLGLWTILALALVLRVAAALLVPGAHHPDEIYQAFEQAHRYAFGYGIKPWEFDDGLRSTLLPALLSVVLRIGDAAFGTPEGMLGLARILLATLSLLPVAAVYAAGLRRSPSHALVGGIAAATWCELVYFSYRPLTEALAADFLLTALALASFRGAEIGRRTLHALGACLALALMLRVHFAPAVALIALAASGASLRCFPEKARLVALSLGAVLPIAAFGLADWLAWGLPFHAPVTAFRINLIEGVAARFGTEPATWYLAASIAMLGPVAIPIGLLARFGAKTYALWLLTAAAILVPHSLIAHKEYRLVFICTPILVIAAAFASVDLAERWKDRLGGGRGRRFVAPGLAIAWTLASLVVWLLPTQRHYWGLQAAEAEAFRALSGDSELCGLFLDKVSWDEVGGYAALHRPIGIYQSRVGEVVPSSAAFNAILARGDSRPPEGYVTTRCFPNGADANLCLLRRPGQCVADGSLVPLAAIRRLGDPVLHAQ